MGWNGTCPRVLLSRAMALLACIALATIVLVLPARSAERMFVQALNGLPSILDPAKSSRIEDDQVMWLLYDALTQLSPDGMQILPALAERWEISPDGLTYTFRLRPNVRFHDGTLLDAEAVKVSYERQFLPGSPYYATTPPNAYERVLARFVKGVQILDARAVAISTYFPRPAQFALVKVVSPAALRQYGGDLSRSPVGTGPYRFTARDDRELRLAAFEGWHGRPTLAGVRFTIAGDRGELVDRLSAGESHLLPNVSPDYLEALQNNPEVRIVKHGGLNVLFLGMVLDRPVLKDRRVRDAIVRAVDRQRLAAVLGRGVMTAATGPLPPACAGYDRAAAQPPYDPPRARSLLQEAGAHTVRLRLLYATPVEIWTEMAQAIQADLRRVGVTVELQPVKTWSDFHVERKKQAHDLYLYSWSISTPDPERILYPLFHSESGDNWMRLADPRIDKLLEDARRPMEEDRRLRIYAETARVVVEDAPALFLAHRLGIAGVNARVQGLVLSAYGLPQDKLVKVDLR